MIRVIFSVDKEKVLKEVRRLTHYAGQRKQGDEGTFERMSATDSDKAMLEQFWKAACAAATEQLMHYAISIDNDDVGAAAYEVALDLPSQYDTNLNESIEDSLKNLFINLIASKWFEWTDAEGKASATAAADALGFMQDIEKKIYHRKRPCRFTN